MLIIEKGKLPLTSTSRCMSEIATSSPYEWSLLPQKLNLTQALIPSLLLGYWIALQPCCPLSPWPYAMSSQSQKEAPSPSNQNTKAGWQVPALCCSLWPVLCGGGGVHSSGWKHKTCGWGLWTSLSHGEWWPICLHDRNISWPVMTRGWTNPLRNLIQPAPVERFLPMMHILMHFLFFCQVFASHCLLHT